MHGSPSGDSERVQGPEDRPGPVAGPPILVIAGPTATGKTALAVALSRAIDGEIVGCDALQVYRRFDIATAKPTPEERRAAPYHLVDCVDPGRDYTLADYVRDADRIIAGIRDRGRVPIVAGGTGMYLRGLLKGVLPAPARSPGLRSRLQAMTVRFGSERMHRWLAGLDPASARRLPASDVQRIIRALEIALTGTRSWSGALAREGTWAGAEERYRALKIGLHLDREALVRRIERRVDAFFHAGLVEEVRALLADGVPHEANAFKAIGYREVLAAIRRGQDPDGVRDEVKQHTRQFSKRQRTWFRKESGMHWLDCSRGLDALVAEVLRRWTDQDGLLPGE